jgi:Putative prokaryotic signal transducing protein
MRSADSSWFEPVTVLETLDSGLMAVAKSLLQAADIPFVVEGEGIVHLLGAARPGLNPLAEAPALRVAPDDAEHARAVLADLLADGAASDD